MVTQHQWRRIGGAVLLMASAMAVYAVISSVLRDTAMVVVAMSSEEVAQAAQSIARWPLILFWGVFALLILIVFYLAAIDIRYIRMQYAADRHTIMKHTLQDEAFRENLRKWSQPTRDQSEDGN